jgi:hypothetical protein
MPITPHKPSRRRRRSERVPRRRADGRVKALRGSRIVHQRPSCIERLRVSSRSDRMLHEQRDGGEAGRSMRTRNQGPLTFH